MLTHFLPSFSLSLSNRSSRLGCQVTLTTSMEGTKIQLPSATRNFYVDGHKPKPH